MVNLVIFAGLVIVVAVVFSALLNLLGVVIVIGSWILAGHIAAQLMGKEDTSLLGKAALGLVGGIIGSIILGVLGFGSVAHIWVIGSIITSILGAILLLYFMSARQGWNRECCEGATPVKVRRS